MIKYLHILTACAGEAWALERGKLEAVMNFLLFKAGGGDYSQEEVQARISRKQEREIAQSGGDIGIIPVNGVIAQKINGDVSGDGGTSTERIGAAFRAMLQDNKIKAILFDMDSPGGAVSGTPELAAEIFNSRGVKPIIAQVNSLAASAAYWIASQADEVVVSPSGRAGSIGVYAMHEDISKFLEAKGVKPTLISAGKYKVEGNEFEPLSDEARANIQDRVNESYRMFVDGVAQGRGVSTKKVLDKFGEGRMFGAQALVERGMADRVGTIHDTLARFGVHTNPIAAANAAKQGSRAEDARILKEKLLAGDRPTVREFENGIKGLMGLSNSEAERAARACLGNGQGEPGVPATQVKEIVDSLRKSKELLGSITLPKL